MSGRAVARSNILKPFSILKHLSSRKGSRTGNSGNILELQVLTQIAFVP
ncbi:uncharacterized protein LOC119656045 [Hermetia illucens]|nr:uncharacterized protein LOC119656045 [Hermetia illucens]